MTDQPWTEDDLAVATNAILKASGDHEDSETFARYALNAVAAQLLERGRSQATEGWKREHRLDLPSGWAPIHASQAHLYGGYPQQSRLVGPWEPDEQPENVREGQGAAPWPPPVPKPITRADIPAWRAFDAQRRAEHPAIDEGQFQREILGMWPPDAEPARDPDACPTSTRVDGPRHSWRWDGDDPRTVCVFCGQMRDALSGVVIREGAEQPEDGTR